MCGRAEEGGGAERFSREAKADCEAEGGKPYCGKGEVYAGLTELPLRAERGRTLAAEGMVRGGGATCPRGRAAGGAANCAGDPGGMLPIECTWPGPGGGNRGEGGTGEGIWSGPFVPYGRAEGFRGLAAGFGSPAGIGEYGR